MIGAFAYRQPCVVAGLAWQWVHGVSADILKVSIFLQYELG